MLIFEKIKPDLVNSSCLALGMFDGVHLGHQKVILDAVKKSGQLNALSTIVTFSAHPQLITARTPSKSITSLDDRLSLFEELGIQAVLVLNFDEELSRMSAEDYIKTVLVNALNAKSISIGYDHKFGAQKKGDDKLLELYGKQYNYDVTVLPPVTLDGQIISSSVIRKLISIGDVSSASKLLGRPFSIKGCVIKGKQRGKKLGFPTANLPFPDNIIAPAAGVYSGMVEIDGSSYYAVINFGKRPTFGDLKEDLIEAHVLNYDGDLYDKSIEVSFLKKLRNEIKFNSETELKQQIMEDCRLATLYKI